MPKHGKKTQAPRFGVIVAPPSHDLVPKRGLQLQHSFLLRATQSLPRGAERFFHGKKKPS